MTTDTVFTAQFNEGKLFLTVNVADIYRFCKREY